MTRVSSLTGATPDVPETSAVEIPPESVVEMVLDVLMNQEAARDAARRTAARQQHEAVEKRIDAMRDAADQRYAAALVGAGAEMANAAIDLGVTVGQAGIADSAEAEACRLEEAAASPAADALEARSVAENMEAGPVRDAVQQMADSDMRRAKSFSDDARRAREAGASDAARLQRHAGIGQSASSAGAKAAAATLERAAAASDRRGAAYEQVAADHASRAATLGDDAQRVRSLQDRALTHLDEIARARHDARTRAMPG